jgi:hypothetical protein
MHIEHHYAVLLHVEVNPTRINLRRKHINGR